MNWAGLVLVAYVAAMGGVAVVAAMHDRWGIALLVFVLFHITDLSIKEKKK